MVASTGLAFYLAFDLDTYLTRSSQESALSRVRRIVTLAPVSFAPAQVPNAAPVIHESDPAGGGPQVAGVIDDRALETAAEAPVEPTSPGPAPHAQPAPWRPASKTSRHSRGIRMRSTECRGCSPSSHQSSGFSCRDNITGGPFVLCC